MSGFDWIPYAVEIVRIGEVKTNWARLVRAVVHGEYFLKGFDRDQQGAGLFFASDDQGREVDVLVVPADAPEAAAFRQHWSDAASLSHPGLMRTLAFGPVRIDGDEFLCAVAVKPDERLSEVLAVRSLTPDETRDVLESILTALAYLHDHKFLHGSFGANAIVASDGRAMLTTGSIRRFATTDPDDRLAFVQEIRAVGDCMVRMLSGPQAPKLAQPIPPEFAMILRTISEADQKWSPNAIDLVHALSGPPAAPEEEPPFPEPAQPVRVAPPVSPPSHQPALVATLAAVLLIAVAIYFGWPRREPETAAIPPSPPPQRATEKPVTETVKPKPTRAETQVRGRKAGDWAVVAAIYNHREAATRRAERLARQWQESKPQVLPPQDGARRYLVVLGSGLSKEEAIRLRDRAASNGMPRDSYVTRLSW
jgi:hypothetical protein